MKLAPPMVAGCEAHGRVTNGNIQTGGQPQDYRVLNECLRGLGRIPPKGAS